MIPIAFYAPLKSPDHEVPSGDRTMARLLLAGLRRAGFAPSLASGLRSLDIRGEAEIQQAIRAQAEAEAARLVAAYRVGPRPLLWFTYHCHYKAPDWIGPRVADALAIPYVVAEGSRSARRAVGPWALGHAGAEAALDRADCLLVMTPYDAEDLEPALRPGQRLVTLPPFLDVAEWNKLSPVIPGLAEGESPEPINTHVGASNSASSRSTHRPCLWVPGSPSAPRNDGGSLRLLTVAMMRAGDKLASYRQLAAALRLLPAAAWTLDIVGDGTARQEVEALFASFGERIRFHGKVDSARLAALYRDADLLVWPAIGEAYGMTLLEAQANGCPVLAGGEGGVPAVVRDGETGILVRPRDAAAFAEALARLIEHPARLLPMRAAARAFVRGERDLSHAADILRAALAPLVARAERALAAS